MSSADPPTRNRIRRSLAASAMALAIVTVAAFALYPRWQAQQWKEKLLTTPDLFEAHLLIQKMLRADNSHAHAILAEMADDRDHVVFAREHRVVFMLSPETGQPCSVTRWAASNVSPNITANFVNLRIVENVPEAVTIGATNEVNGTTSLFLFSYRQSGQLCSLPSEQLKAFDENGYWNEYVARHGDAVAEIRKSWSRSEEQAWQRWKTSVEAEFGPQAVE